MTEKNNWRALFKIIRMECLIWSGEGQANGRIRQREKTPKRGVESQGVLYYVMEEGCNTVLGGICWVISIPSSWATRCP
jgi:hypothetical protein